MMPRQAYAPTPHSYVPNSSFAATINLDEVSMDTFKIHGAALAE
jgi:hypothetical protein